jgi:hypothetical protein
MKGMNMGITSRHALFASVLATLFYASNGHAQTPRVLMSGVACSSGQAGSTTIKYDNRGIRSTNTSSTREQVFCPYVDPTSLPGEAAAYVYDGNTGFNQRFDCTLKFRTATGTIYSSTGVSSSDGYQKLDWGTFPFGTTTLGTPGSVTMSCYMPPSVGGNDSYIIAYYTN